MTDEPWKTAFEDLRKSELNRDSYSEYLKEFEIIETYKSEMAKKLAYQGQFHPSHVIAITETNGAYEVFEEIPCTLEKTNWGALEVLDELPVYLDETIHPDLSTIVCQTSHWDETTCWLTLLPKHVEFRVVVQRQFQARTKEISEKANAQSVVKMEFNVFIPPKNVSCIKSQASASDYQVFNMFNVFERININTMDEIWDPGGINSRLNVPSSDSARLCLIGADHLKYPRTYWRPEAIQRTYIYEYSKKDHVDSDGNWHRVRKGAPEQILRLFNCSEAVKNMAHSEIDKFAKRGFRLLAVGRQEVHEKSKESVGEKWKFVGLLPLFDPPEHDSADTSHRALNLGVNVKMINGDQLAIAKETGQSLGMGTSMYLSSFLLDQHKDASLAVLHVDELIEIADGIARVFPEHKYKIVKKVQERKHTCRMTGDGVNETSALKKADIGITVAARGASDLVLTEPGLCGIISVVLTSRATFRRVKNLKICGDCHEVTKAWSLMVVGLEINGLIKDVLELLSRMLDMKVKPNHVAFIGVLSSCAHGGLVSDGRRFWPIMLELGFKPLMEHYRCMGDLLGRAGFFLEAYTFINNMATSPNSAIWRTFLVGCKNSRDFDKGAIVAERFIELELPNAESYVCLSNLYVAIAQWEKMSYMRKQIKDSGVKVVPGLSTIEIDRWCHTRDIGECQPDGIMKINDMHHREKGGKLTTKVWDPGGPTNTLACAIALKSWSNLQEKCNGELILLGENIWRLTEEKMLMSIGFKVAFLHNSLLSDWLFYNATMQWITSQGT